MLIDSVRLGAETADPEGIYALMLTSSITLARYLSTPSSYDVSWPAEPSYLSDDALLLSSGGW